MARELKINYNYSISCVHSRLQKILPIMKGMYSIMVFMARVRPLLILESLSYFIIEGVD